MTAVSELSYAHVREPLVNFAPDILQLQDLLKPSEMVGHNPGLYLINTRLWLRELSDKYGQPIDITTIPDPEWEDVFEKSDPFVWLMGVYAPSPASEAHSKKYAYQHESILPDFDPDKDVVASPFAIPDYSPNPQIARDWKEWDERVLEKLHAKGKKVIVDFVPNHVGLDHAWAKEHPEYFIEGDRDRYYQNPDFYYKVEANDGYTHYLAHGKDPNFPEWADTLQLNYANLKVRGEMKNILLELVDHADGVRCDMAMLVNPDTFLGTWGEFLAEEEKQNMRQGDFWREVIPVAKEKAKGQGREFTFIAEAYWGKEELQQSFDYIYGKDVYDVMAHGSSVAEIRSKIAEFTTGQRKPAVVFEENHDEPRAISEFKSREKANAAAAILAFIPDSLFLVNQGQEEGRRIKVKMQTGRYPKETADIKTEEYYRRLFKTRDLHLFQQGQRKMGVTGGDDQNIIAQQAIYKDGSLNVDAGAIVCTNYGDSNARFTLSEIGNGYDVDVYGLTNGEAVDHPDGIRSVGLYMELGPWEVQVVYYGKKLDTQNVVFSSTQKTN